MMAQYFEIKKEHRDALLFYRMGDFYEMFFEDAVAAAEALDIALTKRGRHLGKDVPMCGVPVHSAEGYLLTLIRKGFRVAVCEQTEDPAEARKRGSKSVVRREVVRVVTPGTLTEDSLLDARRHNFLAAFNEVRNEGALAWADISTGEFRVMPCPLVRLGPELARLAVKEILIGDDDATLRDLIEDSGAAYTPLARASFDSSSAERRLLSLFRLGTLEGVGRFSRAELGAMGGLVEYLDLTQKGKLPLMRLPKKELPSRIMQIDAATRRNLELTRSLSGDRTGSLLDAIDRTLTPGGARLLERRISSPSLDLETVLARHDAVETFADKGAPRRALRDLLRKTPDLDRALSRLALDRGGPRDLAAIRTALERAADIRVLFPTVGTGILMDALTALEGHDLLLEKLQTALVAEPPPLARDGGFIAAGHCKDLDTTRTLRDEGRDVIAKMQTEYATRTRIGSLKIKHNNVLGYFIETTAIHGEKMLSAPLSETFIHRQTTANAVRFTTVALSEMETKILNAAGRAMEIEKALFETLVAQVLEQADRLASLARALAELDLNAALADLATDLDWTRPRVSESRAFQVERGRHPVVEKALKMRDGAPFIANDCDLCDGVEGAYVWLLTGPNMAGKSTFLRQNALIGLLAQAGAFVPAASAHIGLISQLFSRVGASDDLARGRSTFMVEMVETAAILNQADDRALVILDEIGRGTSTYDGLSIAWATLEHLHDVNKARTLFATHYHEMTALANKLSNASNATVTVKEWEGDVIFLHEVRKGAADRSYGVQVARLAGLPEAVVARARMVLEALEKGGREGGRQKEILIDDLPLFSTAPAPVVKTSKVEERLEAIMPDTLTPMEALSLIYELKTLRSG
ncbi:MAG: DNA mismatch repair protein MutS [Pseudomonadota bacterium]